MSRARELVRWLLLPFVTGAAAGWLFEAPAQPTARIERPTRDAPSPSRSAPSASVKAETQVDGETDPSRCDELAQELATLENQVQEWFGEAPPWPDDPRLGEPNFAAWIDRISRDVPGTSVIEVECSQYPCVGILRMEHLDFEALGEREHDFGELRASYKMWPIKDEQHNTKYWLVAASAYEPLQDDMAWVRLRMNAALSAHEGNEQTPRN